MTPNCAALPPRFFFLSAIHPQLNAQTLLDYSSNLWKISMELQRNCYSCCSGGTADNLLWRPGQSLQQGAIREGYHQEELDFHTFLLLNPFSYGSVISLFTGASDSTNSRWQELPWSTANDFTFTFAFILLQSITQLQHAIIWCATCAVRWLPSHSSELRYSPLCHKFSVIWDFYIQSALVIFSFRKTTPISRRKWRMEKSQRGWNWLETNNPLSSLVVVEWE